MVVKKEEKNESKIETKIENKLDKKTEQKAEKEEKPKVIRNVYIVDYYIKDLNLDKMIESNIKDKKPMLLADGDKVILEGIGLAFKKVEEKLRALKVGDDFKIVLEPKEAYGNRTKDLIRVIATNDFKENKINPFVGLQINADGKIGTVKTISGGRVMVDFNSPFADHKIEVYYKLKKIPLGKEKMEYFVNTLIPKEKTKNITINKEKDYKVKIDYKDEKAMENQIYSGLLKATAKYYFEEQVSFE